MTSDETPDIPQEQTDEAILDLPHDIDRELLERFLTESRLHLREAWFALEGSSESHGVDPETLESVRHSFHTMQADAAVLGLVWIDRLANATGQLIQRAHDGFIAWSGSLVHTLFRILDMVTWLLQEAEADLSGRAMKRPEGYWPLLNRLAVRPSHPESQGSADESLSCNRCGIAGKQRQDVAQSRTAAERFLELQRRSGEEWMLLMTRPAESSRYDRFHSISHLRKGNDYFVVPLTLWTSRCSANPR